MRTKAEDKIRGLRAAAKLGGCSPSGLQKKIDNGDVPARKVKGVYVFAASDLAAMRSDDPPPHGAEPTPDSSPVIDPQTSALANGPSTPTASTAKESDSSKDGEISAAVFADLAAGKDLRTIVVERKFLPEVVERWHKEYVRFAQIDNLKTPAGERRVFKLERLLEVYWNCMGCMHDEIQGLRERLEIMEQARGIEFYDPALM